MLSRKQVPNLLTTVRIVVTFGLLFLGLFSAPFLVLYLIAGLSDVLDGFFARKLDAVSKFGSNYDGFADLCFLAVCMVKILPVLHLQGFCLGWIAAIFLIKCMNLLVGYLRYRKWIILHAIPNKAMGAFLYVSPLLLRYIQENWLVILLCTAATFAALWEGYRVLTLKNINDRK